MMTACAVAYRATCGYTKFGALFLTVDIDFRIFAYIQIFEIAKFVYCGSGFETNPIFFTTIDCVTSFSLGGCKLLNMCFAKREEHLKKILFD